MAGASRGLATGRVGQRIPHCGIGECGRCPPRRNALDASGLLPSPFEHPTSFRCSGEPFQGHTRSLSCRAVWLYLWCMTTHRRPSRPRRPTCSARASLPEVELRPPARALRRLNSFGQPPDLLGIYRAPRQSAMAPAFGSAVRRLAHRFRIPVALEFQHACSALRSGLRPKAVSSLLETRPRILPAARPCNAPTFQRWPCSSGRLRSRLIAYACRRQRKPGAHPG